MDVNSEMQAMPVLQSVPSGATRISPQAALSSKDLNLDFFRPIGGDKKEDAMQAISNVASPWEHASELAKAMRHAISALPCHLFQGLGCQIQILVIMGPMYRVSERAGQS